MKKFLLILTMICSSGSLLAFQMDAGDSAKIKSIIGEKIKAGEPGLSIGIMKDGRLIYSAGFGLANLDYGIANSDSSVFDLASTSKQFTAAAIILLSLEGKLSLEDKIIKYFPDFPAYMNEISIRQLINHTSGIRDYLMLNYLAGLGDRDYYEEEDVIELLKRQKALNFSPGEKNDYSNSGYFLLSQIVEKVSGKSLAVYAEEKIFKPLDMNETFFNDNTSQIVKNRARGYTVDENGAYLMSETTLPLVGDGGVYSTIRDFAKWAEEIRTFKTFGNEFRSLMFAKGILNNGDTLDYASGLYYGKSKGKPYIGHSGSFVGFLSSFKYFYDDDISIFIFTNRNNLSPDPLVSKILHELSGGEPEKIEKVSTDENTAKIGDYKPGADELKALSGDYEIEPGVIMAISLENDTVMAEQKWNGAKYPIIPAEKFVFKIPSQADLAFRFEEISEGKAQKLIIAQNGADNVFLRKEGHVQKEEPEIYAGLYHSEELQSDYSIECREGKLFCKIEGKESGALEFSKEHIFFMNGLKLNFEKNPDTGKITGFSLDSGRADGIYFSKK